MTKKAKDQIQTPEVRNLAINTSLTKRGSRKYFINVLGVGGVGSNIADFIARNAQNSRTSISVRLRIYDSDTVELHNLNRSWPFRLDDIGRTKVDAVRRNCNEGMTVDNSLAPIAEANAMTVTSETELPMGLTIDARDTLNPSLIHEKSWIKLAYDGGKMISFVFRPSVVVKRLISLGGDGGYVVVPSFFVPAAILAVMSLYFARFKSLVEVTDHRAGAVDFDIDRLMENCMYETEEEEQPANATQLAA